MSRVYIFVVATLLAFLGGNQFGSAQSLPDFASVVRDSSATEVHVAVQSRVNPIHFHWFAPIVTDEVEYHVVVTVRDLDGKSYRYSELASSWDYRQNFVMDQYPSSSTEAFGQASDRASQVMNYLREVLRREQTLLMYSGTPGKYYR